jgi:hypothetical protein
VRFSNAWTAIIKIPCRSPEVIVELYLALLDVRRTDGVERQR